MSERNMPMTARQTAERLAEDIVRQWFSRSLGAMNGWVKWKPIWTAQLAEQFNAEFSELETRLAVTEKELLAMHESYKRVHAERDARERETLVWTSERPRVPGYYWFKGVFVPSGIGAGEPQIIWVSKHGVVFTMYGRNDTLMKYEGVFCGPLAEPQAGGGA